MLDATSLAAIRLTIELSVVTTLVLLVLGTPPGIRPHGSPQRHNATPGQL